MAGNISPPVLVLLVLWWRRGVGPVGERVQRKHGAAPAVDGQADAADPDDVHHHAGSGLQRQTRTTRSPGPNGGSEQSLHLPERGGTHHVRHFEEPIGEDDGVRRRGYGQHEGEGGAQGAGDHHVQRVQVYGLGLDQRDQRDQRMITD